MKNDSMEKTINKIAAAVDKNTEVVDKITVDQERVLLLKQ